MEPQRVDEIPSVGTMPATATSPLNTQLDPQPELTPPSSQMPLTPPKKLLTKRIIIVSIIIIVLISAGVSYSLFAMNKTQVTTATSTTQTDPPVNSAIQALTTSLTDNSISETTLTNTDDSTQATDSSTSAGMVGDSVDENNF